MKIEIELTEEDVKQLVVEELQRHLGNVTLDPNNVTIETKSKQNYKSKWEIAKIRCKYFQLI